MTGIPIIYFANDFTADQTSRHHIAHELSKRHPILWVESVGTRNIDFRRGDMKRGWNKLRTLLKGVRELYPNIWVLTPRPIPLNRFPLVSRINQHVLVSQIRRACRRLGFQRPLLWIGYPQTRFAIGRFDERLVVYHATDEYADFPGVDRETVLQMEAECLSRANCVFYAVKRLYENKRRHNPQSFLIPHGVNYKLFSSAQTQSYPLPDELRGLQKPVIGFYGLIDEWLDFELLGLIARRIPNASLVLIGKINVPLNGLSRYQNIHWVPQKPKEELPKYCRYFDAAIVPYSQGYKRFDTTNPIKIKEYLAAGLPAVTYSFPDLGEKIRPHLFVAKDREDFVAKLRDCLERGKDPGLIAGRQDAVRGDSWKGIVELMERTIENLLKGRP